MEKEMFKKAVEHYRKQDELKEVEVMNSKKYKFIDYKDGYTFPINDISSIEPIDFFHIGSDDVQIGAVKKSLSEMIDLNELNKILKRLDSRLFFTLNEIIVVKNQKEILTCEDYIGSQLLNDTLGQSIANNNALIINMYKILKGASKISNNKDSFFHTVVYQFYLTLLHELGHISLRDNLLSLEYSPLSEFMYNFQDEEDVVEWYARALFEEMDYNIDVFKPFKKSYIEKYFNK